MEHSKTLPTARVGVLDATSSALFVDVRNSGLQDLVVLRPDGPLLFLNQGDSRFRLQPQEFKDVPSGFVYEIEEGDAHLRSTAYRPRREIAGSAIPTENKAQFADTWLLERVPLTESFSGSGSGSGSGPRFLHLPKLASKDDRPQGITTVPSGARSVP